MNELTKDVPLTDDLIQMFEERYQSLSPQGRALVEYYTSEALEIITLPADQISAALAKSTKAFVTEVLEKFGILPKNYDLEIILSVCTTYARLRPAENCKEQFRTHLRHLYTCTIRFAMMNKQSSEN